MVHRYIWKSFRIIWEMYGITFNFQLVWVHFIHRLVNSQEVDISLITSVKIVKVNCFGSFVTNLWSTIGKIVLILFLPPIIFKHLVAAILWSQREYLYISFNKFKRKRCWVPCKKNSKTVLKFIKCHTLVSTITMGVPWKGKTWSTMCPDDFVHLWCFALHVILASFLISVLNKNSKWAFSLSLGNVIGTYNISYWTVSSIAAGAD